LDFRYLSISRLAGFAAFALITIYFYHSLMAIIRVVGIITRAEGAYRIPKGYIAAKLYRLRAKRANIALPKATL
jgi:hypothetical protein